MAQPPTEHDAGMTDEWRIEHDSMGDVRVPKNALWRAQTQRAVENFPLSGVTIDPALVSALGAIKSACAVANAELDVLDKETADAIAEAADSVAQGAHNDAFPIDVY